MLAALARVMAMAALTGLLVLTVTLFASAGRGYRAAFGGLIGLIVSAQVAVLAGAGAWFPFSSPALWAANSPSMPEVSTAYLALVPTLSPAVAAVTVLWWQRRPLV